MIITKMVDHNEKNTIMKISLDYNDKDRYTKKVRWQDVIIENSKVQLKENI